MIIVLLSPATHLKKKPVYFLTFSSFQDKTLAWEELTRVQTKSISQGLIRRRQKAQNLGQG